LSLFIEFFPQNYRFIEFTIREFFFTLQNYVSMLICWYISRFLTEIYATLGEAPGKSGSTGVTANVIQGKAGQPPCP
jgi:hypothetical protein